MKKKGTQNACFARKFDGFPFPITMANVFFTNSTTTQYYTRGKLSSISEFQYQGQPSHTVCETPPLKTVSQYILFTVQILSSLDVKAQYKCLTH